MRKSLYADMLLKIKLHILDQMLIQKFENQKGERMIIKKKQKNWEIVLKCKTNIITKHKKINQIIDYKK